MTTTGVKTRIQWMRTLTGFLGMVFLLVAILQTANVSAAPIRHVDGTEDTIILSNIVYLPLISRRYPPIPYAPSLAPITNVSAGEPYTLTWSVPSSTIPIQYYTIQAATEETFSNPQSYTCTTTSYTIPDATNQIIYYRVRGHNIWGDGAWSNVEATQFEAFLEDFDGPSDLDWHAKRTSAPDISSMTIGYDGNGNLETMVGDMFDFAIFSPMVPTLPKPYHIQVRTQIIHRVNEVSYGIAFGGNEGTFCRVERARSQDPNGCFSHYYRLNVIWAGGYLKYNISRIDGHDERGRGIGQTLRGFSNV